MQSLRDNCLPIAMYKINNKLIHYQLFTLEQMIPEKGDVLSIDCHVLLYQVNSSNFFSNIKYESSQKSRLSPQIDTNQVTNTQ